MNFRPSKKLLVVVFLAVFPSCFFWMRPKYVPEAAATTTRTAIIGSSSPSFLPRNNTSAVAAQNMSKTIVSGYYPMESKHSESQYSGWMENFFMLSDPMIIFTSAQAASLIEEKIAKHRSPVTNMTQVVILELNETKIANMFHSDRLFWNKQFQMDGERSLHKSYQLYWVWLSKADFMKRATEMDPFQSDFFAWVDIGYFRTPQWNGQKMLQHIPSSLGYDQILMLDANFGSNRTPTFRDRRTVGGGFIGGYTAGVLRWNQLYYGLLQEKQSEFIGKDQLRMYQTCFLESDVCLLVKHGAEMFGDVWFYMAPFLILGEKAEGALTWTPSTDIMGQLYPWMADAKWTQLVHCWLKRGCKT